MKFAIIDNGKVINIAVANQEFALEQGWVECPKDIGIGWSYDGKKFIPAPRDIEAEWNFVRSTRDELLKESDLKVLPDRWALMEDKEQLAWATYRQALRDIPQSFDDPAKVIWRSKPE